MWFKYLQVLIIPLICILRVTVTAVCLILELKVSTTAIAVLYLISAPIPSDKQHQSCDDCLV